MLQSLFKRGQGHGQAQAPARIEQITPTTLQQRLDDGEAPLVIDVRTPAEYQMGHVPGARLLPLPSLAQRSGELPADRPLVFVCRSGSRSQVACEMLARQGYGKVANLSGGMISWQRAGLPVGRGL